jgi:hypothetical protein
MLFEIFSRLITVFEFLSFLASLTLYLKRNYYLRYFPGFLLITVIVEIIGNMLRTRKESNLMLYNFFGAFEIVFYPFVFYHIIQSNRVKRFILYFAILYPAIAVVNICLQKGSEFQFNTYCPGAPY